MLVHSLREQGIDAKGFVGVDSIPDSQVVVCTMKRISQTLNNVFDLVILTGYTSNIREENALTKAPSIIFLQDEGAIFKHQKRLLQDWCKETGRAFIEE
jgi:hypothetical protein